MIKSILSFLLIATLSVSAMAQASFDLEETKPVALNGIEYGFAIRNESKKDVGSKGSFGRFEVTVYATNKSGCTKLLLPKQTLFGQQDQDLLAQFDCINATGMRLTSKSGNVRAPEFFVPYSTTTKNAEGKTVTNTIQVKAGHILHNGETVSSNFIVIVPESELPRMKVRIREFLDQ
ncbi:hypothetical protein GCM10023189_51130 [Nibrella saemangeumensis]|uniref:ABC transporter permease n=1 Tax=Nibrella saemangeumensis TaxID=1084526 RepID=A0ABP8NKQ3_9BACT